MIQLEVAQKGHETQMAGCDIAELGGLDGQSSGVGGQTICREMGEGTLATHHLYTRTGAQIWARVGASFLVAAFSQHSENQEYLSTKYQVHLYSTAQRERGVL